MVLPVANQPEVFDSEIVNHGVECFLWIDTEIPGIIRNKGRANSYWLVFVLVYIPSGDSVHTTHKKNKKNQEGNAEFLPKLCPYGPGGCVIPKDLPKTRVLRRFFKTWRMFYNRVFLSCFFGWHASIKVEL